MKTLLLKISKWEFEYRIFISLSIVLFVCSFSSIFFPGADTNPILLGRVIRLSSRASHSIGFTITSFLMALATGLRMWAGSVLCSDRVMAFKVQYDVLMNRGPYQFVRNPIYLADIIAMCGFALCFPPIGILLPLLFFIHYIRLIKYEETSLNKQFGNDFDTYIKSIPRLIPNIKSLKRMKNEIHNFEINKDGFRHNALYVLFIFGFVVAALTGVFFYAVIIGLPAVLDWAFVHTRKGLKNPTANKKMHNERISSKSKVFEDILYAQCWEDPQLDRIAFNIQPNDVIFSITSGGCNALTFLLDNPKKVIALDISPYQNYVLKIKLAAFKTLCYEKLLVFLGVIPSTDRKILYNIVRTVLDTSAQKYWDNQQEKTEQGIIHCGRYEHYMHLLRKWLERLVGKKTIHQFFQANSSEELVRLYEKHWNNLWWRIFVRVLLSRTIMTLLFDKAFFQYLDKSFSFGEHFAERAKHALTELPVKENYFLAYILLGHFYSEDFLPLYLRRENFEIIRNRLDRIEIITERCESYFANQPDSSISKFNFTNIFEWMSPNTFEDLLKQVIRVACDGAVVTYRNLLVFREHPKCFNEKIHSNEELARVLHNQDLSFIYNNYVVEHINKKDSQWNTQLNKLTTAERCAIL